MDVSDNGAHPVSERGELHFLLMVVEIVNLE
jgi:hypothetical protein